MTEMSLTKHQVHIAYTLFGKIRREIIYLTVWLVGFSNRVTPRLADHFHPGVSRFNTAVGDDMIIEYNADEK